MSDDQFAKLFKYIEAFRTDVDKRFIEVRHEFDDVRETIVELSVRVEDYHQEVMVLSHQFDELRGSLLSSN